MGPRLMLVAILLAAACGGDSAGIDAPAAGVDAPAMTACGGAGLMCDYATQICVVHTPVGPSEAYTCMAVPSGCFGERSCACASAALCTGAFDTCSDSPAANTITCECPECQ
jgi:hypothetical protein